MNESGATVLHQHLVGRIHRSAMQHAGLIFGSNRDFASQQVNTALIQHLEQLGHATGHFEAQGDAMGTGEVANTVIVISHRVALEDKKAGGAVKRAHVEGVRQGMRRVGRR